jgi:hypothetical protein
MPKAASFRGLRRDIAFALRGRRRTLYEVSKAIGRRPGDIQRTVRQMAEEGLLISSDPKPVRGTLFAFNEEHSDALEAELATNRPPGQLVGDQRVLAIAAAEGSDPYAVLGRNDLNGLIEWVAEWGGDGEFLVGMAPDTSLLAAEQLARALKAEGVKCVQRRVGELQDASALRRHAVALTESQRPVREEVHT